MNWHEHLTAKLDRGGHFLDPDGILATYDPSDYEWIHEDDHRPGSWWSEALMHVHEMGADGGFLAVQMKRP